MIKFVLPAQSFSIKRSEQNKSEFHVRSSALMREQQWYRLKISARNAAARDYLATGKTIGLGQNENFQTIRCVERLKNGVALCFYRTSSLKTLSLAGYPNGDEAELCFTVSLKPIVSVQAIFHMMWHVAMNAEAAQQRKSYIFRITRARQKRSGWEHAKYKLIQTYQPLLQHQLKESDQYVSWVRDKEPRYFEKSKLSETKLRISYYQLRELDPQRLSDHEWIIIKRNDTVYRESLPSFLSSHFSKENQLIYWDHDYLNSDNARVLPQFKPNWDPTLLLHTNYIGSAFAIRGDLLKSILTQKPTSHYELLLSCLSLEPKKVQHIPLILQHQQPELEALSTHELKAIKRVAPDLYGNSVLIQEIEHHVLNQAVASISVDPKERPLVSIIIPTRDSLELTRNCVNSVLERTSYSNYEILILDNQSTEPDTLSWFKAVSKHEKVRVIRYNHPFNYSAINNFAVTQAAGEYVCLLNNDTEVIAKAWLSNMLCEALKPNAGCVGAKLYYADDTVQHAGVILGLWGLAGHSHKNFSRFEAGYQNRLLCPQQYSAVTAACLLVKKSIYQEVSGLNEKQLTVAFNDVDFCLKVLKRGYQNYWTPHAELYHFESKSRGKEDTPEKKERESKEVEFMKLAWCELLESDPAYHRHLAKNAEDFSLNLEFTDS